MILIKNAKILTMAGKNIESGYIIIRDGKIRQLGTDADMPSETGFEKVIDAHEARSPGFVTTVISECGKTESVKKEPTN